MYGTEEMVAEAIEGRRDEVFLVFKVLPSNATRKGTVRACEQSLKRLRTDRLDCYLLHWPGEHPLEDTIAAFEELQAKGKIPQLWREQLRRGAARGGRAHRGRGRIACDQVLYSLSERHSEARVLPKCRQLGAVMVGYSPFHGLPDRGELLAVALEIRATPRQGRPRLPHPPAGHVSRFPRRRAWPTCARNAGAATLTLTEAQIARLDRAYPIRIRPELPVI